MIIVESINVCGVEIQPICATPNEESSVLKMPYSLSYMIFHATATETVEQTYGIKNTERKKYLPFIALFTRYAINSPSAMERGTFSV